MDPALLIVFPRITMPQSARLVQCCIRPARELSYYVGDSGASGTADGSFTIGLSTSPDYARDLNPSEILAPEKRP